MSSGNIYFEILDYDEGDDRTWFSYAWDSIDQGDFEEVDSRKDELGDLEISLLEEIFREHDESDLRSYTVSIAKEYDLGDKGPASSFG